MTNHEMFFFFFSSIVLASAIFVIYSQNTVYSVFFLILVFVNSSGLLLLSEIEFLAFMLIIIYVGAITILFLFVIMMLDIPIQSKGISNFGYIPILSFITFIFFIETILMFSKNFTLYYHMIISSPLHFYFYKKNDLINEIDFISNIETLGQILYTYYSVFFLMAGIILLIALIGAVSLTKKEIRRKHMLQNNLFKQVSRNSDHAIFNSRSF
jgi:NADH-quinone oxidoreductase subunit J